MKILGSLILVTVLAFVAVAQRAENNTDEALKARNAPDVFVYKAAASGSDGQHGSSFTIEVGNMGKKVISAIEWEYNPPEAVVGDRGHLKFRNADLELQPQEKKSLTREVRQYTVNLVASFNLSTIRILRVEYDDGSAWQRPADNK